MENPRNLILVIFGASGDLTSRKLIPALFSLKMQKLLPGYFAILGVGRTYFSDDDFRKKMRESIKSFSEEKVIDEQSIEQFAQNLFYRSMDNSVAGEFDGLRNKLDEIDAKMKTSGNYIFYMATPPSMYSIIAGNLSRAGLSLESGGFRRLIIEKPFGYDLESGRELNRNLHELVAEEQIFRIDHYLGKETVQNVLVTRFANGIFEPLWNRNYIHRVEITSAESMGVEERGGYYDSAELSGIWYKIIFCRWLE
jgi:glucose-6-phosphate 1-dehydrogenase